MSVTTTRPPRRPGTRPAPSLRGVQGRGVLGDDDHILNLEVAPEATQAPEAAPAPEAVPRRVRHLIVLPGGGGTGGPSGGQPPQPVPEVREDPRRADRPRRHWLRRKPADQPAETLPLSHVRIPAAVPAAPAEPGPSTQVSMSTGGGAQAQLAVEALPLEVTAAPSFKLRLKVISRSVTASRTPGMPFIVLASILISVAVLGMVVLHVMVDQYSFRVDSLQAKVNTLHASLGQLSYQVSVAEAPQRVAAAAGQLGLTPATQIQVVTGPGPHPGSVTASGVTASGVTGTVKARH